MSADIKLASLDEFKSLRKDLNTFKNDIMNNLNTAFKYWIVGLVIMFVSNIIIVFFNHNMAGNEQSVRQMINVLPFFMLINAGFIAPFNEEIIFRKSLGDIFKSKWLFVFLSFLLFGGAHVIVHATTWKDYLFILPYGSLYKGRRKHPRTILCLSVHRVPLRFLMQRSCRRQARLSHRKGSPPGRRYAWT